MARYKESDGYVYFIQRTDGAIKIGISVDVVDRIKKLSAEYGENLVLIGAVQGYAEKERKLHTMFSEHNIEGEWFRPVETLSQWISDNAEITNIEDFGRSNGTTVYIHTNVKYALEDIAIERKRETGKYVTPNDIVAELITTHYPEIARKHDIGLDDEDPESSAPDRTSLIA